MRTPSRPRLVLLAAMLSASGACSLLVSTNGLTSTNGTPAGDQDGASGDAPSASPDASPSDPTDASVSEDASPAETSADSPACTPVASGLRGHWRMDVASINGTTLTDSSGNHNDGTLMGFTLPQPQTAPAPFAEALTYPATGQAYVDIPTLALDTADGGVTSVSMWFYRAGPTVNDVLALLPNSPRYDLWLTSGSGDAGAQTYLCINAGHNDCYGIADTTLLDRWVHVVAVFVNGPTVKGTLYLDGQKRASACLTSAGFASCDQSAVAGTPVTLGGSVDFFYHGALDDVRVYGRALTASEVGALYSGAACP